MDALMHNVKTVPQTGVNRDGHGQELQTSGRGNGLGIAPRNHQPEGPMPGLASLAKKTAITPGDLRRQKTRLPDKAGQMQVAAIPGSVPHKAARKPSQHKTAPGLAPWRKIHPQTTVHDQLPQRVLQEKVRGKTPASKKVQAKAAKVANELATAVPGQGKTLLHCRPA
jgi:hypothetical protein